MVLYELTVIGLKVSILTEWIHMFVPRGTRNTFYWTSTAIMTFNMLYYSASILSISLVCDPRARLCHKSSIIFIISAVVNVVSDIVIIVLPIKTIWRLQLSSRKRLSISFVFSLGIL